MGVEIKISGSKFSDDAKVLNNAHIENKGENVHIDLDNVEMNGKAELAENLEIKGREPKEKGGVKPGKQEGSFEKTLDVLTILKKIFRLIFLE